MTFPFRPTFVCALRHRGTGRGPAAQGGDEPRAQQQGTEQRGQHRAQRAQREGAQQSPRRRATQLLAGDTISEMGSKIFFLGYPRSYMVIYQNIFLKNKYIYIYMGLWGLDLRSETQETGVA